VLNQEIMDVKYIFALKPNVITPLYTPIDINPIMHMLKTVAMMPARVPQKIVDRIGKRHSIGSPKPMSPREKTPATPRNKKAEITATERIRNDNRFDRTHIDKNIM
jgi:hypothetical protein